MKIKDFTEFADGWNKTHHFTDGVWCDDVNWKGLRMNGYTHCIADGQLRTMGKYGPDTLICVVEKHVES